MPDGSLLAGAEAASGFDWGQALADEPKPAFDWGRALAPNAEKLDEQEKRMAGARQHAADKLGSQKEIAGVTVDDIVSRLGGGIPQFRRGQEYQEAEKAYQAGTATDEQLGKKAEYELLQNREANDSTSRSVARMAARLPGMGIEVLAGGGATRLGLAGAARLGVPGAAALTTPAASLIGRQAQRAGQAALSTPLAPALYLDAAQQRATQNGGDWSDAQNLLPALGMAGVKNVILGTVGGQVSGIRGGLPARLAGGGAVGTTENMLGDVVLSAIDKIPGMPDAWKTNTKFGTIGDLLEGKTTDVWKHLAGDMLAFTAFSALHGKDPQSVAEKFKEAVESVKDPASAPKAFQEGATPEIKAYQDAVAGKDVFDRHPELEAGGKPLLEEMRAAKEYPELASAVPEDAKPIGKPNQAFVYETKDGQIVRVGRAGERADIPEMLQATSVKRVGPFQVETLPKVDRVGDVEYYRQHRAQLEVAVEKAGYRAVDLHPENVGEYQGRPVFIDPGAVRAMAPGEAAKLQQAREARNAALGEKPQDAIKRDLPVSGPPTAPEAAKEEIAPPAAPQEAGEQRNLLGEIVPKTFAPNKGEQITLDDALREHVPEPKKARLGNLKQNREPESLVTKLRKMGGLTPESAASLGLDVGAMQEQGGPSVFQDAKGRKGTRHIEDVIPELVRSGDLVEQPNEHLHDTLRRKLEEGAASAEGIESVAGQAKNDREYEAHLRAEAKREKELGLDFEFGRNADIGQPNYALPSGASPPQPTQRAANTQVALAPPAGTAKQVGQDILRANLAALAQKKAIAETDLKAGMDHFDAQVLAAKTPQDKTAIFLHFTDAIEGGQIAALPPETRPIAEAIRKLNDERTQALKDRDMLSSFVDNYLGHIWKKPGSESTPEELGRMLSARRPLAGSEAFTKKRTMPTYRDGIDAGLEPADPNPVRLALLKLHEIDKAVMAHDTVEELKANNMWKFVRLGGEAPPGSERINDKIATVFAPPEHQAREYFDKQQMEGLETFARSLGVDLKRVTSGLGKAAGLHKPNEILTKFGTPEEVLAHEIGHELDTRYGIAQALQGPVTQKEMLALADLRASGRVSSQLQAYLRSPPEQAANLVAAYLHAPDLLRQTAPVSANWLDATIASHKELHPLRDIKPSLELGQRDQMLRLAGPVLTGHYYTPADVATLMNNHVSPGLAGRYRGYDAVRVLSNAMNQFQLGFSAFHAGFVAMDTQVSAAALGLQMVTRGELKRSLPQLVRGMVPGAAPFRAWVEGSKMLREYFKPGSQGAETAALVDSLVQGGGRAKMDAFYGGTHIDAFRKALREVRSGEWKRTPSLLGNALPALAEAVSKPVMEHLVPRMKLGVFADLARAEMDAHPNMSPREYREALGRAWDSVENRLGQLTYDNLFWNRAIKDTLMVGVRSVGWNTGTIRELGGGVKDLPRSAKGIVTGKGASPRTAYLVALPMVAALYGSIYQYLATGHGPDSWRDAFFPRTGRKRPDGSDDRVSLPSYIRDLAALTNRAGEGPVRLVSNVWTMAKHKLNPGVSTVAEMLNNEDYYGKALYLPEDSSARKSWELAKHLISAFEPLAVRSLRQQNQQNAPASQGAQGFVGVTPAPAYVTRSDEQQRAIEKGHAVTVSPQQRLRIDRRKNK